MNKSEEKYLILSQCNQPIELHLAERVLVLTPHGTAELDGDEITSPQLQILVHQRFITVEEKESDEDDAPATKRSSPAEETRKKPTAKKKSGRS